MTMPPWKPLNLIQSGPFSAGLENALVSNRLPLSRELTAVAESFS